MPEQFKGLLWRVAEQFKIPRDLLLQLDGRLFDSGALVLYSVAHRVGSTESRAWIVADHCQAQETSAEGSGTYSAWHSEWPEAREDFGSRLWSRQPRDEVDLRGAVIEVEPR